MNTPKKKKLRKPLQPRTKGKALPVMVNSYFKNGKRVTSYKRRSAGDAKREEE